MTLLGQSLRSTERRLARIGIGDARIEADLIWMTALEVDRAELYARTNEEPTADQAERAEALMLRRLNHEPAAYLMGHREFYGVDLVVGPGALIPRPDTETLVEEALRIAASKPDDLKIADVGCGTGAIAIALAANLPNAIVTATDISPRALELARDNVGRQGLADRITLVEGDLLEPLGVPVDLITANLPYVMSSELPTLDPEIRMYEPPVALDGGDDGLDLIRRLLSSVSAHLRAAGVVLLEMDPRQIASASEFAAQVMPTARVRAVNDLTGRARVLVVET
ncbi:MAG: peptide chain release factor N(5)-glutamine methyltransferase [Chloroflexi bacterium]|nr:peptide chain release factor N(5)-glutamine methyltransferase [Chloroflexota bacterium]